MIVSLMARPRTAAIPANRRRAGTVKERMPVWADEEIARLRALTTEGLSTAQVASTLAAEGFPPRSRNAIIGKCTRVGIDISRGRYPVERLAALPKPKPKPVRAQPARPVAPAPQIEPIAEQPPPQPVSKGWPKPATETQVWYLDDKMFERCRMPLWGDHEPMESRFYCGAPTVDGTSYCASCRTVTLVKPVPRAPVNGQRLRIGGPR
jgi:hypothetical protein